MDEYIHSDLVEIAETVAFEQQRITCQEEERSRKGFDTRTYFYVEGDLTTTMEAIVKTEARNCSTSMPFRQQGW
jgi:hypothetical protein